MNKIGHPNIIDIFAFGQLGPPDRPQQYFVMDYLEGETLAARLARSPPIADDEARRLLVQTADALEAAHRERIIHRDLKPENLWIARPKHGESFVKVLDFGVAKLLELTAGQNVTVTGTVIGTPYFMAPEQCLGQSRRSARGHLCAGRRPLRGVHRQAAVRGQDLRRDRRAEGGGAAAAAGPAAAIAGRPRRPHRRLPEDQIPRSARRARRRWHDGWSTRCRFAAAAPPQPRRHHGDRGGGRRCWPRLS